MKAKILLAVLVSFGLSGCYQVEMKETLKFDGSSEVAIQMDVSALLNMTAGIQEQIGGSYRSCNDPKLLEEYKVPSFSTPAQHEARGKKNGLTCEETTDKIKVTTHHEIGHSSRSYSKPKDEAQKNEEHNLCENNEEGSDIEASHLIKLKCENQGPGIATTLLEEFDTSGFTINNDGTTTFDLENSALNIFANSFDKAAAGQIDTSQTDPAKMGLKMEYILTSPWPIVSHTVGQKEGEKTLRIDLLKIKPGQQRLVTFATDGQSLKLLSKTLDQQLDSIVVRLKEKLDRSNASLERQQEYLAHVIVKLKTLSEKRPDKKYPLSSLMAKLFDLQLDLTVEKKLAEASSTDTPTINLGGSLSNNSTLARDSERRAGVRNMATIMKTARAVETIKSFDRDTGIDISEVLEEEGGYEVPPSVNNHPYYYGYESSGREFFFFVCSEGTQGEYFIDGTTAAMNSVKDAQATKNWCNQGQIPDKPLPGYKVIGSYFF